MSTYREPNWSKLERDRARRDQELYDSQVVEYRYLEKDELIEEGDEIDACADAWRDPPRWEPVHPSSVGKPAPDPQYPSHRRYRRRIT